MYPKKRALALALGVLLAGSSAFTLGRHLDVKVNLRTTQDDMFQPFFSRYSGEQLVMIFVGSSTCDFSNHPDLPRAVERIKLDLQNLSVDQKMTFKSHAVAADWDPRQGLAFLQNFGAFHEVSAGYNWANEAILKFFWELDGETVGTPHILILKRVLESPSDSSSSLKYSDHSIRPLMVLKGTPAITGWNDAKIAHVGVALMATTDSSSTGKSAD